MVRLTIGLQMFGAKQQGQPSGPDIIIVPNWQVSLTTFVVRLDVSFEEGISSMLKYYPEAVEALKR
jgi:hypothetical protein